MAEAERELDSSPLEVLSDASVGPLGVTFCCGGQETPSNVKTELLHTNKTEKFSVKSQTAGMNVNNIQCDLIIFVITNILIYNWTHGLSLFLVPRRSPGGAGTLMFVRLRVQSSAGKKKSGGVLHLGIVKTLHRRDAWLALSQERYTN